MPRDVKEWVGVRNSTPVPPRVRLRVLDRFGGFCAVCTMRILGPFVCDHVVALVNQGENREINLQPLCAPCNRVKTDADVAAKSKTAAIRRKRHGAKYSRQGFRGWRRFDGSVVRRDEK